MVSLMVIGILSAIVIPNYASFDSATLLENEAYEVSTSLREAQVFALSARGSGSTFALSHGLSFSSLDADKKTYTLYRSNTGGGCCTTLQTYTLDRTIQIADLCVSVSGSLLCKSDGLTRLDIAFIRPEFQAVFNVVGLTGVVGNDVEAGFVELSSPRGSNVWVVRIGLFGDISVYKKP